MSAYICRHGKYRSEHVCDDHLDRDRITFEIPPPDCPPGTHSTSECVSAHLLTARAEAAEDIGEYDRRRADALAASIRPAAAAALNDAADEIESATMSKLSSYGDHAHAETARIAIQGCVAVLRRRAMIL